MALWQTILLIVVTLIAAAIAIEMYVKRNRARPPLARQFLGEDVDEDADEKPELGMEAIDMDVIRASELGNRSAASLGARDMEFWTRRTRSRRKTQVRNNQGALRCKETKNE